MKGLKLPYIKQGLIYFTCLNYDSLSEEMQNGIDLLCYECGKEYKKALFELVTTQNSVINISQKYYVSESLLYRLRKRFYSEWDRVFSDSYGH